MNDQEKSVMLQEVGKLISNAANRKYKKPRPLPGPPSSADSRRKWRLTDGVIEEVINEAHQSGTESDKK